MPRLGAWREDRDKLTAAGVRLPEVDDGQLDEIKRAGTEQPRWIHVGGGNLYRAFHAQIAQDLIDAGELDCGVAVMETHSPFTVDQVYTPYDCNILQVVLGADGTLKERVLACTSTSLFCNPARPDDLQRAQRYFVNPDLQLVTFTITEKGYNLTGPDGSLAPDVEADIAAGPSGASSTMGIVTALLYARYVAGAVPIAMVSTDNFSRNGERFRSAVVSMAQSWREAGWVDRGFVSYVSDESLVSFPWTMIDRITPNPSPETARALADEGWSDLGLIHNGPVSFAGFANTEEAHYLVMEDSFPNGRPPFERAGVIMCDRQTAERADTMKVTACLNPLHTALAVFGCLLGYDRIWREMGDPVLARLVRRLGYDEDLPVVEDPGVIDPKAFIDELVELRLPNPGLPDTPQRIAQDTSQKIPVRYGHTLKAYLSAGKDVTGLVCIPLVFAGWLRYLMGVDDALKRFEPAPDPMLTVLQGHLGGLALGERDAERIHEAVAPILSDASIFGVDLYSCGLGGKVEGLFSMMLAGPGAVRSTLQAYV